MYFGVPWSNPVLCSGSQQSSLLSCCHFCLSLPGLGSCYIPHFFWAARLFCVLGVCPACLFFHSGVQFLWKTPPWKATLAPSKPDVAVVAHGAPCHSFRLLSLSWPPFFVSSLPAKKSWLANSVPSSANNMRHSCAFSVAKRLSNFSSILFIMKYFYHKSTKTNSNLDTWAQIQGTRTRLSLVPHGVDKWDRRARRNLISRSQKYHLILVKCR